LPFRDAKTRGKSAVKRRRDSPRTVGVTQLTGPGMWSFLKWLAMKLAIVRWIFKILGLFAFLPIAFLLKAVGLPLLIILAVLALPVLLLLFLFGLPIFLVMLAGGLAMGVLFAALAFGVLALKVAIFVVLPMWLLWKLASWIFSGRARHDVPRKDPSEGVDPA
jgi:hypothetical protein